MKHSISRSLGIFSVITLLSLLVFSGCAEETEVEALPASVFNSLYGNEANANFDDGSANGWAMDGLWHISSVRSASPSNSAWYGDETSGDYDTGAANSGSMKRSVDLTNVSTLDFDYFLDNECIDFQATNPCNFDNFRPQVSTDGGATWTDLIGAQGLPETLPPGVFIHIVVDLTPFTGTTVGIRFYFDSVDSSFNAFEGAFVDNIVFQ